MQFYRQLLVSSFVAVLCFVSHGLWSFSYSESQTEEAKQIRKLSSGDVPTIGWQINDKNIFSINQLVPMKQDRISFWAKSESVIYDTKNGVLQERQGISTAYHAEYDCRLDRINYHLFFKDKKEGSDWQELPGTKIEWHYAIELAKKEEVLKLWFIGMNRCHSFFPERYAAQRKPNFKRPN